MNKRILILVTLALTASLALAAERPAEACVCNSADHDSGVKVTRHQSDSGEAVVTLAESDYRKLVAWYQEEMSAKAERARFLAELDALSDDF